MLKDNVKVVDRCNDGEKDLFKELASEVTIELKLELKRLYTQMVHKERGRRISIGKKLAAQKRKDEKEC